MSDAPPPPDEVIGHGRVPKRGRRPASPPTTTPPPAGPPPPDQPPVDLTDDGPPSDQPHAGRRRWVLPAAAGVAGLLVGVGGTVAVVALTADDDSDDDVRQACGIVAGFDDDTFEGDPDEAFADTGDLYRASAAANLFFAANDGEFEGELGDLGQGLQVGFQTFNPESALEGLDDARAYCDAR